MALLCPSSPRRAFFESSRPEQQDRKRYGRVSLLVLALAAIVFFELKSGDAKQ